MFNKNTNYKMKHKANDQTSIKSSNFVTEMTGCSNSLVANKANYQNNEYHPTKSDKFNGIPEYSGSDHTGFTVVILNVLSQNFFFLHFSIVPTA